MVRVRFGQRARDFKAGIEVNPIDVTDGAPFDALVFEILHVPAAHAASANDAHDDAIVGSKHPSAEGRMGQHPQPDGRAAPQKSPTRYPIVVHESTSDEAWHEFYQRTPA